MLMYLSDIMKNLYFIDYIDVLEVTSFNLKIRLTKSSKIPINFWPNKI